MNSCESKSSAASCLPAGRSLFDDPPGYGIRDAAYGFGEQGRMPSEIFGPSQILFESEDRRGYVMRGFVPAGHLSADKAAAVRAEWPRPVAAGRRRRRARA